MHIYIATSMQYQSIKPLNAAYIRDVKPNLTFFCVIPSLPGTHALLSVNKGGGCKWVRPLCVLHKWDGVCFSNILTYS